MSPAVYLPLLIAGYLYAFWVAYIAVMGAYRAQLAGRLTGITKVLAYPLVLVGLALDVICQYTIATAAFADLPASGEHLVTDRLQRYVSQGSGWRCSVAGYICNQLLDVFDPSGDHC